MWKSSLFLDGDIQGKRALEREQQRSSKSAHIKTADCTKNSDVAEKTVVRFDSPLHHAAVRFDSPLHHAAGSQTLILITPQIWKQIRKKLRIWIRVQGGYFWWKKTGGGKSHATVPLGRSYSAKSIWLELFF
jgi:hypothetical protein